MQEKLFLKLLKNRRENNHFMNWAKIQIDQAGEGWADLHLVVEDLHLNPNHALQGGALMTMADAAMGTALCYLNEMVTTADLSYRFLGPVYLGDRVDCRAETTKLGRRLVIVEAKLSVQGRLVGIAQSSFMRLGKKIYQEEEDA